LQPVHVNHFIVENADARAFHRFQKSGAIGEFLVVASDKTGRDRPEWRLIKGHIFLGFSIFALMRYFPKEVSRSGQ
jgi:hypothetical protein